MILALVPSIAFGSLIDLTPGGFIWGPNQPQIVSDWYANTRPKVELFDDNLFTVTGFGTPNIIISWDLRQLLGTFEWLFVQGTSPEGDMGNFYKITSGQRHVGEALVTINGETPVIFFTAFGTFPAPDTGTTLGLFLIGLVSLYASRHYRFKSF